MLRPHSQGHRGYFEAFKRRSNSTTAAAGYQGVDVLNKDEILTDRGAYLSFLEVQLERVSRACVATQDFGHRIDVFAAKAAAAEEKVTSATKLIRLAQTYSEEQGRDQATINDALEERLAILEQQVDAACSASYEGVWSADRHRPRPVSSTWPGLCGINTAGLSEWMTGVDKQLHDLHELISAGLPAGGSGGHLCGGTGSGQQAAAEGAGNDTAEGAGNDTAAAAPHAVQDEYAGMEERVSRLEATLAETVADVATPNGSFNAEGSARATESERGRRPSPKRAHTPPSSPPLRSPSPQDAVPTAAAEEDRNETRLLDAVQEGTTVARRASELAQEALQAGKEAVERSERTESLAKALAVRSLKLASEQHGQLTDALDRLTDDLQQSPRRASPGRTCGGGNGAARSTSTSPTFPAGATGRRRGFEASDKEAARSPAKRSGRSAGSGAGEASARIRGRGGHAPRGTSEEGRATSPRAALPRRGAGRAAARDSDRTAGKRRSVREIREILEKSSFADSDNGRRLALGAARTALESILREASPGPLARSGVGGWGRRGVEGLGEELAGGGDHEVRSVGELREAIRGAVSILAGIEGSSPAQGEERQKRRHSRRPQRGSRSESHSPPRLRGGCRSRDRPTTPPRGEGRDLKRHAEGYWVPPGTIPCKVGERRAGGPWRVRAPWEMPDGEGEGEERAT